MPDESVVLFYSHNYALWAGSALKAEHIPHKVQPVPRELSSECGYCLRIGSADAGRVLALLENKKIEYDRIVEAP